MFRLIRLIAILIFALTTGAAAQDNIVRVVTLHFAPYVSEDLPSNGWAWEVCATVLREAGYEPQLTIMPWARAVTLTKEGRADALYLANINEERKTWAVFTDPVGEEISVAFKRRDKSISFQSINDLNTYRVAGLHDAHVSSILVNNGVEVHPVASLRQGFRMVYFGRVDTLVVDRYVGLQLLQNEFPPAYAAAIDFVEKPVDSNKLHLAISRKYANHDKLRQDFNRGLAELRASGRFDEILDSYGF
ncbi:substrate-binding periplasmic protein [Aestuariispira ectoiniformans]|uniref:substrate-binding periplasmic protein n=1 Tax=Aestuariispira ectoiniformans TaxID=2775080 RepID=UPI00223C3160|nr:transporter substrate-binding domain-containing protein [Aestuariispira ectoiniformans]